MARQVISSCRADVRTRGWLQNPQEGRWTWRTAVYAYAAWVGAWLWEVTEPLSSGVERKQFGVSGPYGGQR